jgi:opacity protein-like surface antigen
MFKRMALAAVSSACVACALALTPAAASAASASHDTCTALVNWSLTLTTATASYGSVTCDSEQAAAGLSGLFPQYSANGGLSNPSGFSETYLYSPTAGLGLCFGGLFGSNGPWSGSGVLNNDGDATNEIVIQWKSTTNPVGSITEVHGGFLQPACAPSFTDSVTWTGLAAGT